MMASTKSFFFAFFLFFFYQQANGAGVTECYFCIDENCDDNVEKENCVDKGGEGEYSCLYLYDSGDGTVDPYQVRGCVSDDDENIIRNCAIIDEMENATCTICSEDLCNTGESQVASAKLCYSCNGVCEESQEIQQCPEGIDHVCLSIKDHEDFGLEQTKGCLPKTKEFLQVCKSMNDVKEGTCQICQEDLCNI